MSRRKFLKDGVLVLGAPLAAAAGSRLYGAPASIQPLDLPDVNKFKLPLSRAGVSPELWDGLSRVCDLWDRVLADDAEASRFASAPAAYMQSLGLDASDSTLAHESMVMLQAMVSPEVKSCLQNADYDGLFTHLASTGVFEQGTPSALEEKITAVFRENYAELSRAIEEWSGDAMLQRTVLASLEEAGMPLSEDDLTVLSQLLSNASNASGPAPMCTAVALCAVAVGIAATVAAYVSVVVAVTVVMLVAVSVSAAVQTAVGVGGGGCTPPRCIRPNGTSAPFTGVYARLDPSLIRNLNRSLRLAALTKDRNIEIEAVRSMISTEVAAVLGALNRVDLLKVQGESMQAVIDAVTAYSWKMLGISVEA